MTTSQNIVSDPRKNPDELIADITKLMDEAEAMLRDSTSQHAEEKVELLRARHAEAENLLAVHYATVKATAAEAAKRADATIRAHPYAALSVALGLGVLLGVGLARRR